MLRRGFSGSRILTCLDLPSPKKLFLGPSGRVQMPFWQRMMPLCSPEHRAVPLTRRRQIATERDRSCGVWQHRRDITSTDRSDRLIRARVRAWWRYMTGLIWPSRMRVCARVWPYAWVVVLLLFYFRIS